MFSGTKARMKIGQQLIGKKIAATVQGYVLYKEYDQEDKKFYYWEEWELTGFNDYDSWIEYDHYTKKVTLYEPVDVGMQLDPAQLQTNQLFTAPVNGKPMQLHVKEVGAGVVAKKEGTLTYHVFKGDVVAYAEIYSELGTISVEKYNDKEYDVYLGQVLSSAQQKEMLGRVVGPSWLSTHWQSVLGWVVFGPIIILLMFADALFPQYQSFCTPRTTVSSSSSVSRSSTAAARTGTGDSSSTMVPQSTDEVVSQDNNQTCYRRRVQGGGSGGVGK